MQRLLLLAAMSVGATLTWIDTRPGWDDTGISAMLIFLSCAAFGAISPRRYWLWALAIGLWIPLIEIVVKHTVASILALILAFAGAASGAAIRRVVFPVSNENV